MSPVRSPTRPETETGRPCKRNQLDSGGIFATRKISRHKLHRNFSIARRTTLLVWPFNWLCGHFANLTVKRKFRVGLLRFSRVPFSFANEQLLRLLPVYNRRRSFFRQPFYLRLRFVSEIHFPLTSGQTNTNFKRVAARVRTDRYAKGEKRERERETLFEPFPSGRFDNFPLNRSRLINLHTNL